ncbi:MAG TPA: LPS export ABC transporter permease LptF [Verrucomicrobiae bacterium]|jgi:LPS export ABC transporter permease LptF/LPS export ABC transporter permease LptG|nr:LPS export ABC transporter permease LptF [Verrucomicrobiae bacterium]
MRLIDRYICRQIFSHSFLGLGIFTFVFFVPQLVRLMDLVVRHPGSWSDIAILFLSTFPGILSLTLPMGVLIGVLIALGRLSADSELIAMSALGMGRRRLLVPVGILALGATAITFMMTLWLSPLSVRTFRNIEERLRAGQASYQVAPRVFDERFPRMVLYVNDIDSAATRWRGVFLAGTDKGVSRLTLAEEAIVVADRNGGKLQLHLRDGSVHEFSADDPGHYSLSAFGQRDFPVEVKPAEGDRVSEPGIPGRTTLALWRERKKQTEANVELQRRLAVPFACVSFALLAMPIGARPRRGGRAAGFLITLVLITGYYLMFTIGATLAHQGAIPVWAGIWSANFVTAGLGLFLLPRLERMPGSTRTALAFEWVAGWPVWKIFSRGKSPAPAPQNGAAQNGSPAHRWIFSKKIRRVGIPQLLDAYLLRGFVYYFILLTIGFIVLFEVFTFFDLLDDIARHRTGLIEVVLYFAYLACYLFYQLAPLAALVSVLVTLGIMTKNNELVAFKASGLSLYRVAAPLLLAGIFLATGLVALDDTYLPFANQRQDALRNEIKGRPAQTYYQPSRQWIFGENAKIYNYELFDPDHELFGGLNVFELDPATFAIKRRIYAARAHWDAQQGIWILESGWIRDFDRGVLTRYTPFLANAFNELSEPPSYFNREVRQSYQMTWWELKRYIGDLQQAGFDVGRLSVQLQRKLSFPLIAPIIILLAVPFSILVGTRGAVGGLALGIGIAIIYWAAAALTEAMGAVGQLPPLLAAWAPDTVFGFLGLYFFLKMPT